MKRIVINDRKKGEEKEIDLDEEEYQMGMNGREEYDKDVISF